jgi:hypothetical protein
MLGCPTPGAIGHGHICHLDAPHHISYGEMQKKYDEGHLHDGTAHG